MKTQLYKKTSLIIACLFISLCLILPAWSLTIGTGSNQIDVGFVDTLEGATHLSNSGGNTEELWVESILNFDVTLSDKIEGDNWNWMQTNEDSNTWALELQAFPEYYIVKTGNLQSITNTHFLFNNTEALSWAVIDLTDFGASPQDINIFKVSHVSTFTGVNPVPEPATMLLFGIGLLGIAGLGRKSANK